MILRRRRFSGFLFCAVLIAGTTWAQPESKASYDSRIEEVSKKMAHQAAEGLKDEGIAQRFLSISGNFGRSTYNRIPLLPKWTKPVGQIRQDFFEGMTLLHDIATDPQLDASKKARLIDKLAGQIAESLNNLTRPFADPIDARLLDSWKKGATPGQRFGNWILTRLLFVPTSFGRDLYESLWPFDSKKNPSNLGSQLKFRAPDAVLFFGMDWRLNSVGRGILRDGHLVFRDAVRHPTRSPESAQALSSFLDQMQNIEPIRYASFNSFTLFMYTAAQVYFLMAPPFHMASEPTVLGGVLTGIFGLALPLQIVKQLHKSNSGYSIFKEYRRLRQAGSLAPTRWIRNFVSPMISGWKIFTGASCASTIEEIGLSEESSSQSTRPRRGNR